MKVTSTTAYCCSVATSSSESLPNDGEKPNQPKRFLFPKCDYGIISIKSASALQCSAEVVFLIIYWEDGCSRKTGAFCKHKSSSFHNQAVEVIFK